MELPRGFRAAAASLGIKASGRPDVAIVAVDPDLPAASVGAAYTTNQVLAAPVLLSRSHLSRTAPGSDGAWGWTRGILVTAGCANAATGPAGLEDQGALAQALADGLGTTSERTLALSTGVIGTRLPVDRLTEPIAELARDSLRPDPEALAEVATAMMTTDSRPKLAMADLTLPSPSGEELPVRVTGVAKGVGMIHPRLATMLAIVMTDAAAEPSVLQTILARVAARTWNQISVDGDTSTNDTVFLLASGASRAASVQDGTAECRSLEAAVEEVARSLARQQAADGEGATTLITCTVRGARDDVDARAVARAVVSSSLVKAAVHGRDPNWGRVASAAGNARVPDAVLLEAGGFSSKEARERAGAPVSFDPASLQIEIAQTPVFRGSALPFDRKALGRAMAAPELLIALDLGAGPGTGEAFGCDLTEQYVRENAEYTT